VSVDALAGIALAIAVGVVVGAGLSVLALGRLMRPRVEPVEPDLEPVWPSEELDEPDEPARRHRLMQAETDLIEVVNPDPVRPYMRAHLRGLR
jgi:hypothetical protein